MKKRYKKKKEYRYKHYSLGFPARLNEKIEPHTNKNFEVDDFTYRKTAEQEIINITLTRNKPTEKTRNQEPI
jgi:hypothetical protein